MTPIRLPIPTLCKTAQNSQIRIPPKTDVSSDFGLLALLDLH